MSRISKKLLTFAVDAALMPLAVHAAVILRMGEGVSPLMLRHLTALGAILIVVGLSLAVAFRIHSIKLSSFDLRAVMRIGASSFLVAAIGSVLNVVLGVGAPRTLAAIFGIVVFALMVGWRALARRLLEYLISTTLRRVPVAVYGAGAAGVQLISALNQSDEFRVVAVVDDSPGLRGVYISGLRVQPPSVLPELAISGRIGRIVLAMPSVRKRRRREIVASLESLPCEILTMPGYGEMIGGGDPLDRIRSVSSDDLLGRNIVDLDVPDVANAYSGRSVLITGAGGSIGSELCRQVLSCSPRRIVLLDASEFALYTIDREVRPVGTEAGVEVATVLGSVCDRSRVRAVMQANGVDIVLHAAAYKHVPLVEDNELAGVKNNVFGTRMLAELARELAVERFILVSTDKAVRPTNVMGGTKRLAEIMIQDLQTRSPHTKFAMVRFGNVLGSSGSVIPLFAGQIAAGGPITLTHADVTRYFMTISEAARLVLLAGAYATGGDLFVLDMGKPIRIADLARRMVELSGLTVRDAGNPEGDIEIRTVGLRPGEKLYEELLIDNVALPTPHRKIMRAEEGCPSEIEVAAMLQELRLAVESNSAAAARRQIGRWVEGYRSEPALSPVAPG